MVEFCNNLEIVLQLFLAIILGGIVGLEREFTRKEAGLRTFSLVSLGASLFVIVAYKIFDLLEGRHGIEFDPTNIIGQIVLGVGFLGAGLIIFRRVRVEGLTTAAALWVAAGIGAAIGVHFYFIAIFVTFLTLLVLAGFRLVEARFLGTKESESYEK
jgi:putative Mg2+ transporter-C (MgtC) family protein